MTAYHRLLDTTAVPWRLRRRLELWTENRCRDSFPALYRRLHLGSSRDRVRPLTSGPMHHFFGYYDKSPWNADGSLVLAHEASFNDRPPAAADRISLGVVDLSAEGHFRKLADAAVWNWQQGAMLQWNPNGPQTEYFHNDLRDGRHVAVLRCTRAGERDVFDRPIYALTADGKHAFSLNFARLQTLRPGYGYAGAADPFASDAAPSGDGLFHCDLATGRWQQIVSTGELAGRRPAPSMRGAFHYLNHVQASPRGSRVAFFHIWCHSPDDWRVRLYAAAPDGTNLVCVLEADAVSHYDWLDEQSLLIWAEDRSFGRHFLLLDVQAGTRQVVGAETLREDGHCSFSPDRHWVLNDTYPDEHGMRTLMLYRWPDGPRLDIARLHSPKSRWWGEIRCDLHPRWRRDGRAVCIDSVHEGTRQMYAADVGDLVA